MTGSDLVLHTVRCIGFAGVPRVAAAVGLAPSDVESELIDLAVAGLVTRVPGEFGGWGLTDPGRAADAERVAAELAGAGIREQVAAGLEAFLVLNPELLDLVSAWQLRDGAPVTAARILDRVADLDRRADSVCAALAAALPRFGRYRVRLTAALDRVLAGEVAYLADELDSYHTIWFQLHEDLLATLGVPR
jgi:hypothetical protein